MIKREKLMLLAEIAINAAIRAGKKIVDISDSNDLKVNLKSDQTPQTLADLLAHEEIKKSLGKTRIPVLSEEGRNIHFDERKNWDIFWMVDPLDGTNQFIKQESDFTVNIALIVNNYPIMGFIYAPLRKTFYAAHAELGTWKRTLEPEDAPNWTVREFLQESQQLKGDTQPDQYTAIVSRTHLTQETKNFLSILEKEKGNIEIVPCESSLKFCLLAEGSANIYPRMAQSFEWDTAAGQAIAEGAGFLTLQAETNERLLYNKESLVNPWFICKRY